MSLSPGMPFYQDVDGYRLPGFFSVEAFRSAIAYKPRADDLFIVTYPKCGTTWVQNIVTCIFRRGESFRDHLDFLTQSPFLEMAGAESAHAMRRPGAIKLHVPFRLTPYNPEAKYIYVARNPKDCCVSFYHHTQSFVGYKFEGGKFDDFFELFVRGETDFGDYFDHLLPWYEHRNDPNVLFLTYEQLKEDTRKCVLEIARFIGAEYEKELEKDPELLGKIIKKSSFDHLKKVGDKSPQVQSTSNAIYDNPDVPEAFLSIVVKNLGKSDHPSATDFFRKGIVGDWRNHFSEEQSRRMDEIFKEKTAGTDIPKLWEKYM